MPLAKPRNICDKITPEFPLAPISKPLDSALATSDILSSFAFLTSFAPEVMDKFIFVPVSPSGTGNTFNASIFLALFVRWCARSEEHTSELQSRFDIVCHHLLDKKKIY